MQEVVEKRSRTGKVFDLGSGKFRAEIGNHSHVLKNGLWIPAQTAIDSENGTDSDTGLQYIAKSMSAFLDYDIKFGKNDPVWMKIKHVPTGKKITFKPKKNTNRPNHVVAGNKLTVFQAWDGIDMEIYVTDQGTKTNYIITSAAGQRVVEFDVAGDVSSAQISPAWYKQVGGLPYVEVPKSFTAGVLSYDFRSVPVGTVVDPTVTLQPSTADAATPSSAPTFTYNAGIIWFGNPTGSASQTRAFIKFDLSSISAGATVNDAYISLKVNDAGAPVSGENTEVFYLKRDWVENQVNWNAYSSGNSWQTAGAAGANDIGSPAISTTYYLQGTDFAVGDWLTFDVTSSANDIVNGTYTNYGWRIGWADAAAQNVNRYWGFDSRSAATEANRPKLTVDYTEATTGGGSTTPTPVSFNPAGKQYLFGLRGWR